MTSSWKRLLLLAAACWVAFVALLVVAYSVPAAEAADGWAVNGFLNLQTPWLDAIANRFAHLADLGPFALFTVLLVATAIYRRRPRHALAVIVLLVGANVLTQTLKAVLHHDRWHTFLGQTQIGPSAFPSGHATASMTLAVAAVLVAPAAWRRVVAVVGAVFALAVSESIMLLAWHFPSDVAGGFFVATACALMTVAGLQIADQRWHERTGRDAARRAISGLDVRQGGAVVVG